MIESNNNGISELITLAHFILNIYNKSKQRAMNLGNLSLMHIILKKNKINKSHAHILRFFIFFFIF